jgi:hypothetical protein
MTATGCFDPYCPSKPAQFVPMAALPSPRTLPVNIPFSNFGITVVTMDQAGNLTIKVDQPFPKLEE